jgi:hypothetical protein
VQARLSPKKVQWTANEAPEVEFDLRNQGKKTLHGAVATAYCELQVDGTWYQYRGNYPGAPLLPLKAGVTASRWLAVSLGSQWLEKTDAKKTPDKEGEPIRLAPGKHTIRVAYRLFREVPSTRLDKEKVEPDVRVATNAIEIEVTNPPEKKGQPKKQDGEDANTKPIKIGVYIEKVNVDTSTITASCVLIGEVDNVTKPLRFENLRVAEKAKITVRGKEVKLTDLQLLPRDTPFYLFLKAYEFGGFEVVGMETVRK